MLFVASYLFYSFAGIVNFAYILITTITTWFAAVRIDNLSEFQSDYLSERKGNDAEERKAYKEKIKPSRNTYCLHGKLGILAVLKYAGHFEFEKNLALCRLISFIPSNYGYLIDVYRGSS